MKKGFYCVFSVFLALFVSNTAFANNLETCLRIVKDPEAPEVDKIWCEGYIAAHSTTTGSSTGRVPNLVFSRISGSVTSGYEVPYNFVTLSLPQNWRKKLTAGDNDWATIFDPAQSAGVTSVPESLHNGQPNTSTLVTSGIPIAEWLTDSDADVEALKSWASELPQSEAGYTVIFPSSDALKNKLEGIENN